MGKRDIHLVIQSLAPVLTTDIQGIRKPTIAISGGVIRSYILALVHPRMTQDMAQYLLKIPHDK
jgi:hypothetical protein